MYIFATPGSSTPPPPPKSMMVCMEAPVCLSWAAPNLRNALHLMVFPPPPLSRRVTRVFRSASPDPCQAPRSGWNPLRALSLTKNCSHSRPEGPSSCS